MLKIVFEKKCPPYTTKDKWQVISTGNFGSFPMQIVKGSFDTKKEAEDYKKSLEQKKG